MRTMLRLALIAAMLFVLSAVAIAQSSVTRLGAGDSLTIGCATRLAIVPDSSAQVRIMCEAQAEQPTTTTAPAATVMPAPTAASTPIVTGPGAVGGLWLTAAEVAALPMSGAGWSAVSSAAKGSWGAPNLSDLNANHDVLTLAGGLYYARTGDAAMRAKVAAAILSAMGTESSSRALEVSRNITSYVIAADLIGFRAYSPAAEQPWRAWLSALRTKPMTDGRSIVSSHEDRPNNWGTHAAAARIAIDRYIGDGQDLARAASVFRGWLGDRSAYAGFSYGDLAWQANASAPVGINPKGATKNGQNIDGVLPDDQRRAGGWAWPPPCENYVHEGLQGGLVAAELLRRGGFDSFEWSDRALLRSYVWLHAQGCPASGDDSGYPHIVNRVYGSHYPAARPAPSGKNMGFLDWTHGS